VDYSQSGSGSGQQQPGQQQTQIHPTSLNLSGVGVDGSGSNQGLDSARLANNGSADKQGSSQLNVSSIMTPTPSTMATGQQSQMHAQQAQNQGQQFRA